MPLRIFTICILFLFYLNTNAQTQQNNETVVYAFPVKNIVIDGNLDDWPKDIKKHNINNYLGKDKIVIDDDCFARFQIAYQPESNRVYIGVHIIDNEFVSLDLKDWKSIDSYTLYVDEQHKKTGSAKVRFSFGLNFFEISNDLSWDPNFKTFSNSNKLEYRYRRSGKETFIEIAYSLENKITSGQVIGIGHLINDKDSEKRNLLGWVPKSGKSFYSEPGRIGNIIFLDDKTSKGSVSGKVLWKDSINVDVKGVIITSLNNNNLWVYVPVDKETKVFSAKLPIGKYKIQPAKNHYYVDDTFYKINVSNEFIIKENETNVLNPLVLKPIDKPRFRTKGNTLKKLSNKDKKQINSAITQYMAYYNIEGVAFAALKNGKVAFSNTYGTINSYTKKPITNNTLFEAASITKPTFAFATLRLYEKGLIDLDEPLYKYLPFDDIKQDSSNYEKLLTARIILSHKTGLPNWGEMIFENKPGTQFSYSGAAYQYLASVLEEITQKDINTILKEEVLEPLHIKHFYYKTNPYLIKHKAYGHFNGFPNLLEIPENPGVAWTLMTNTEALAKFIFAIRNKHGLKPDTYKQLFTLETEVPEDEYENNWKLEEYVGLGLFIEKSKNIKAFRHSGNNGNFKCLFRYYEGLDYGYIIFTNSDTGGFIIDEIEKILYNPLNDIKD